MLFRFCCDESYDGAKERNTVTISGFFSDQKTWKEVEKRWQTINFKYGVSRFHAQPLNRKDGEYKGWDKTRADSYSAELLTAINDQGNRMRAYNCGMHSDVYRSIISDQCREKLGQPWMVCFNSCVAMIAKDMESLPEEDIVSVIPERGGGFDVKAVKSFGNMTGNPLFPYRHRLKTCEPESAGKVIGLQVADLMAFEYFKRLHDRSRGRDLRHPYKVIREHNVVVERFFGAETLTAMKDAIESNARRPGPLVIIPNLA